MDEKDLKIEALLQRVAELTRTYEDKIADLRVEVTALTQRVNTSESNERQVLEGEVVND